MIKRFFTTNISLKLISLVLSILMWIYLVVLLNPQIEVTISNVPITYSDHSVLTQKGYVITNNTTEYVSIKLKGTRSMLANVNKNNISAYIDLSGCSQSGTFSLPVHIRLPYDEISITDKSPSNVTVVVERVIEENVNIQTELRGEPKEGYSVEEITPEIRTVTLKGAYSYVKSISKAVLSINTDGIKASASGKANIILYNSRNEIVSNNLISVVPSTVSYFLEVVEEKQVDIDTSSLEIPPGYMVSSTEPAKITIFGNSDLLKDIDSLKVMGIEYSENVIGTYEVKPALPDGVNAKESKVLITIKKEDTNE